MQKTSFQLSSNDSPRLSFNLRDFAAGEEWRLCDKTQQQQ